MTSMRYHRSCGFSLIEILTTLAIAASLAASAVPSLNEVVQRLRLRAAVSDLALALDLARSEAISSGRRIAVAPRTAGDWSAGWRVFRDENDNGEVDRGEAVLMESPTPDRRLSLQANFGNARKLVLSFGESGFARRPGSNALMMGRIVVSDAKARSRVVCFGATRVRVLDGAKCSR